MLTKGLGAKAFYELQRGMPNILKNYPSSVQEATLFNFCLRQVIRNYFHKSTIRDLAGLLKQEDKKFLDAGIVLPISLTDIV